jgi:hypothetical protein
MLRTLVLLVALCNCGNDAAPPAVFVTEAFDDDGAVSVAVVADGAHVAAYVCADDVTTDPYPGWFFGDARDGAFDVTLAGWTLSGNFTSDGATGTIVDPTGKTIPWTSAPATGWSGVYSDDSGCAGVIVLDRGTSAPTVRGAFCNVLQVTPVLPLEVDDDKLAVDVGTIDPWRLWVSRVRSARR